MSHQKTPLPALDRGRMIAALRSVRTRKWRRHTRYRYRVSESVRRYSDTQIREALHLTKPQFARALAAYEEQQPHRWTQREMGEKVLAFAVKHKHWPTTPDYDKRNKVLDLPPRSSIAGLFNNWRRGEPSTAQLVRYIVEDDKLWRKLTPELILAIRNVTVRRAAMEKYGVQRLLQDGGGTLFQEDEYGKLWRLPSDNSTDKHAQWVEVVNATAEPDGSFAHFFLRVPPTMETAQAAVAWTFNLRVQQALDIKAAA